eukprot:9489020-Pyramimonas_sp.AAC.1
MRSRRLSGASWTALLATSWLHRQCAAPLTTLSTRQVRRVQRKGQPRRSDRSCRSRSASSSMKGGGPKRLRERSTTGF